MPELKSRLKQKHDTEANWNKATNFVPLVGEIIVYDTDSIHRFTRMKVGDGSTKVTELPFLSNNEVYKNLYNLGAYDTFVDNGNGTATITRKTGYFNLSSITAWTPLDGHGGKIYCSVTAHGGTDVYAVSNTMGYLGISALWGAAHDEMHFTAYLNNGVVDRYDIYVPESSNISSADDLITWLSSHPTYVQYELATSYTEEVILDQPIHTIDQHGEQWLRDEWEKGLNLNSYGMSGNSSGVSWSWDGDAQTLTFNASGVSNNATALTLMHNLPNGAYTVIVEVLSGSSTEGGLRIGFNANKAGNYRLTNIPTGAGHASLTTVLDNNESLSILTTYSGGEGVVISNLKVRVALYKGEVNYPWHPYCGNIVRQKDIEGDISPSNIDLQDGSINLYKSTTDSLGGDLNLKGDVVGGIYFDTPKNTHYARYMCMVDNDTELATASMGYYGTTNTIPQYMYLTLSSGQEGQEPYYYGHSSISAGLFIDRSGYVTSQGELRENNQRVATQNWVNNTLGSYVPQVNLSSQAQVDLNELTDAGMYRMGSLVVNGPTGITLTHGQVLVVHGGGDTVAQIGFPYMDTHHVNIRVGNPLYSGGGVWSEWQRIVFADEMTQYALKTDIPLDATTTTKGIATLGASGGAARYGQKGDVGLSNVDNVKQYSASNPPPYPVTSVNGQTGAVVVKIDDGTL